MTTLSINRKEQFQHLPHAPIVEAVIDIRAHPEAAFEETMLKAQLEAKLGGYRFLDSMQHLQVQHAVNPQVGAPVGPIIREPGWQGLRFQSGDQKHIAQFNRNGFVFSRLEPYESWEQLYTEGMRLWAVYVELARHR